MKNIDYIKSLDLDDIALRLMCPYDTDEGLSFEELPCSQDPDLGTPGQCLKCLKGWLEAEHEAK